MSSTSSTSFYSTYAADPPTTAKTFADNYTKPTQDQLTTDVTNASQSASSLTALETALTNFQSSLAALTTGNTSVLAQTATFTGVTDTVYGTATAKAGAVAGSYNFFVQQIATAGQVTVSGLTGTTTPPPGQGTLVINQPGLGNSFSVDLSKADTDGDNSLTPQEIAAAINASSGNSGKVTASVVTINGQSQLSIQSTSTGANSGVSIDASGITGDGALQTALTTNATQGAAPQDAIIWLGDQNTGTEITQASNTFSNVDGVNMTFTKAMPTGTAPITLTVATNASGTATNLQNFVTAYNTLKGVLTPMLDLGDPTSSTNVPGAFANDSGVRALSDKLISLVTQTVGGVSLANYGITNQLDGTLALNTTQLNKTLASNPAGLSNLMGGSSGVGTGTGLLGSVDKYMETWSDASNGFVAKRQADVTAQQKKLTQQQTDLNTTYNSIYANYLAQFTQLQTTENQMHTNTDLFDALFGSSSN